MSAPTPIVRADVYSRDENRCVACDSTEKTFQHRRAVGMGGSKIRPSAVDGLTLCGSCNMRCEADLQTLALVRGWKCRRWADPMRVPVYYPHEFGWFLLTGTRRKRITAPIALELMEGVYGPEYFRWRMETD